MPPAGLAILTATVLALALRLFLVTRPGFLTSGTVEYDDGVYLGAALRLLHGALPYKDYAFVQPPGIVVVALPGALVGIADLAGHRARGGPRAQRAREHRLRPAGRAARPAPRRARLRGDRRAARGLPGGRAVRADAAA